MNILLKYFVLFIAQYSLAKPILVPTPDIGYGQYRQKCESVRYDCTTDYFVNLIQSQAAVQFNQLIDEADFSSSEYLDRFRSRIIHIVNTEILDLEQASLLLDILKLTNLKSPSFLFKSVEKDITRAFNLIAATKPIIAGEFALVFKKPVSINTALELKTTVLKIPIYLIHYSSLPIKSNSQIFTRHLKTFLISGRCEKIQVVSFFKNKEWALLQPKVCSAEVSSFAFEKKISKTRDVY